MTCVSYTATRISIAKKEKVVNLIIKSISSQTVKSLYLLKFSSSNRKVRRMSTAKQTVFLRCSYERVRSSHERSGANVKTRRVRLGRDTTNPGGSDLEKKNLAVLFLLLLLFCSLANARQNAPFL